MRRHDLLHVLRAADGVVDGRVQFVVIGSQAILGTTEPGNEILARSMEADLAIIAPTKAEAERYADLVSGTIGDGSPFESTFGYYADGVEITTAKLPAGWEQRLLTITFDAHGNERTAKCLSAADLAVSKLMAGREKDFEFVGAMLDERLVDGGAIIGLLATFPGSPAQERAENWLQHRPPNGLLP